MTSRRKTKPAKPGKTRLVTREAEGVDGIEKALDKLVRNLLEKTSDERMPAGMPVIMQLGSSWWLTENGKSKFPMLTDAKAAELVERAKFDPHAFDAASYLAAVQFSLGKRTVLIDCPNSLVSFGVSVLSGDLKRPTQRGRKHRTDILLVMLQYALCRLVANTLRLPLGKNIASREKEARTLSACELVAEAFTRAGATVTAKHLESFCYDAGFAQVREVAKACGLLDHNNGINWLGQPVSHTEK